MVRSILVAAFRRCIEIPVGPEELLAAAPERRVRMKDLAGRVLEEDAIPGAILGFRVRVH